MSFIEANNGRSQENIFRKGFSFIKNKINHFGNRVNDIISGSQQTTKNQGFNPLVPEMKEKTFSEGFKNIQKSVILGTTLTIGSVLGATNSAEDSIPEKPTFRQFNPHTNNKYQGFGPIYIKSLSEKEILPTIDPKELVETSRKINKNKIDFCIPYTVSYFDEDGGGYQKVPKGTQIKYEDRNILSLYDKKTAKYQAYAKIEGFTKTIDESGRTIENISEGYIRTPWFDGVINRKEKKISEKIKPKTVSFAGWIGPNGKNIDPYKLKTLTMEYFGSTIIPLVEKKVDLTKKEIAKNRKGLVSQVLKDKKILNTASGYEHQIKIIEEKKKWENYQASIQAFAINGEEHPDAIDLLKNFQKKPEWQLLLQKAAYAPKGYSKNNQHTA